MKNSLIFLILLITTTSINCQNKIEYGNNTSAGKFYNVRGVKMYVEQYGNGKPLIMIHGNGGSIASMSSIIPFFSQQYHVIAIDSRAHGKSIDAEDSISFEMMSDDNAALLQQMHIDSAYVIGWSDGGIIALELAIRHPEKVIKLVSTGANLWPDSTAILPSLWKHDKLYYDSLHLKKWSTEKEKNNWKIFMLDWTQPNIPLSDLAKIKCPSLIVSGDHDVITLEHTLKIYQAISRAYLWILPNSGHATLIEHTDDFNKKVNDFFIAPYNMRK